MREMKFKTPSFHKGANTTIRLGKKWDNYRGPIGLYQTKDGAKVGEAIVVNTERKKFSSLTAEDIKLNHDTHCTDLGFLEEEMLRLYGDKFNPETTITIVTFVIDGGVLASTTDY